MIQQAINRSRSTGGGMGASLILHGTAIFLLTLLAGRQVVQQEMKPELTEITYIEATDADDIAAKVQAETPSPSVAKHEPPGRGIETQSAMKPKEGPAPAPVSEPVLAEASVEAPVLEKPAPPAPKIKAGKPRLAPQPEPQVRKQPLVEVAAAPAPAPAAKAAPVKAPAAKKLPTANPKPASRKFTAPNSRMRTEPAAVVADAQAPVQKPRRNAATDFQPAQAGLQRRNGTIAPGDDVLAADTGRQRTSGLAQAGPQMATGNLQQRKSAPAAYAMTGAALKPASGRKSGGSVADVADVAGPSGTGGGGSNKGRRTILDYGNGGGGRGGGLKGKGRLAEPTAPAVETAQASNSQVGSTLAEAKVKDLGSNMTISGQIQGRKILQSVPAAYSDQARRKGWEGVVAVHFTVLADGRVKDNMYFEQTSVHRDLNQAAMAAIKKFRFAPLGADQAAVEQWGVITIVFRLN